MSSFVLKPVIKSMLTNPPPLEVWKNTLLYKLLPGSTRVHHTPISLVIYTTKRCNFKCEFCFTYDDLNKPEWRSFELTNESYESILNSDFGRRALRIGFLGGEPFMNPLIFEFLVAAHRRGKVTTVVSNGSLITGDTREKLLKDFPTMLGLSWYDNNEQNILELSQWLAHTKKYFWVQKVIAADELSLMKEKLKLAKNAGIKNLIFSNYNPVYSGQTEKVIFDDNRDFFNMAAEIQNLAHELGINLTLPQPIQRQPVARNCKMPFSYVHLDSKGTMGACCFRAPNEIYGNIYQKDAWNSERHVDLRKTFLNQSSQPLKECRYCENFSRDLYGF